MLDGEIISFFLDKKKLDVFPGPSDFFYIAVAKVLFLFR